MATEKLEIQVSADVQNAVAGINKLNTSLKQTTTVLPKFNQATGQTTQTLTNFGRVVQDAPFGIIGIANNIDPLISSFTALRTSTGSAGAAFKALGASLLGPAGIAIGISVVTSALISFGPQIKSAIFGTKELSKAAQEEKDNLDKAADSITKNYTQVLLLTTALKSGETTLAERKNILTQLNDVSEKYFGGLNAEKLSVEALDKAYDGYINNLLRSFAVKQLEQDLDPLIKRLAVAQLTIKKLGNDIKTLGLDKIDTRNLSEEQRVALSGSGIFKFNAALAEQKEVRAEINKLIESALFITTEVEKKDKGIGKSLKDGSIDLKDQLTSRREISDLTAKDLAALTNAGIVLDDLQRKFNELRKGGQRPTQPLGLTNEQQLNLAGDDSQVGTAIENIETIKKKFIEVNDVINNGINAGIDQFFNALANNQDPFEALAQSVKRLVAELAAAVVKALILKAVTAAITGGTSAGGGLLAGVFGGGVLRGDQIRSLTFLRG